MKTANFVKSLAVTELRYRLEIAWSEEDRALIARVPELPGCMADGDTYEAAVAAVQIIIAEWIETARKIGRVIPLARLVR